MKSIFVAVSSLLYAVLSITALNALSGTINTICAILLILLAVANLIFIVRKIPLKVNLLYILISLYIIAGQVMSLCLTNIEVHYIQLSLVGAILSMFNILHYRYSRKQ